MSQGLCVAFYLTLLIYLHEKFTTLNQFPQTYITNKEIKSFIILSNAFLQSRHLQLSIFTLNRNQGLQFINLQCNKKNQSMSNKITLLSNLNPTSV